MNIGELEKQLQQKKVHPVYLVDGADEYIQAKSRDLLLQLIPEEQRIMNVGTFNAEQMGIAAILNDAESAPFFGDFRLVIVEEPVFLTGSSSKVKDVSGLLDYLSHPEVTTILLIQAPFKKLDGRKKIVKELKKKAQIVDASRPSEQTVKSLIRQAVEKNNYQISSSALDSLIIRTDNNLLQVMNELEKLYLYSLEDKRISEEAVKALVPMGLFQNVFDLINALLKRNLKLAIQIYSELLFLQEQPLKINGAILSQFRLLIQVKILMERGFSQGKIAEELRAHPYRTKLAIQTARNYTITQLENIFQGVISMEHQLKSTQKDPQEIFELFLVTYGSK